MKKDYFIILGIILCGLIFYGATLRGDFGNPGPFGVNSLEFQGQPFELSSERGRYAEIYSLAVDHTYSLSQTWAIVISPDVGVLNGKYYSLFAPGVSYLATPFYIIGSKFDLGQVAAFGFMSLVALVNILLIYIIGRRIMKLPVWAALFAALIFGFGSTAWSYAVTLYEHQISVLMLLLSFYAVWKFRQKTSAAWAWAILVGFCYALGIFCDYPDILMLFPVILYFIVSFFSVAETSDSYKVTIRWIGMCTAIGFIVVTGFQLWSNQHYFGSWKRLAGGLPSYNAQSVPAPVIQPSTTASSTSAVATAQSQAAEKDVTSFFKEQDIPNSSFILLFSSNRGLLYFSPIFILALLGIYYSFYSLTIEDGTLLLCVLANVLIYSSWGDPWGGWAYGPRYLVLSMSVLSLFIARGLAQFKMNSKAWSLGARIVAFGLFAYSAFVAFLGALVTNAIPQAAEASLLPVKFDNFLVPLNLLSQGTNDSFIYNSFLYSHLSIDQYFIIVYFLILLAAAVALFVLYEHPDKHAGPDKPDHE